MSHDSDCYLIAGAYVETISPRICSWGKELLELFKIQNNLFKCRQLKS